MKNKKGFTLIELLAVIVILAIIMVIAVPKILDIINKSRESAASSNIKLIKDAIKTQVATSGVSGVSFEKDENGCYPFNFDDQTDGNAKTLSLKNKEKIKGQITYCPTTNTFTENNFSWDGESGSSGSTDEDNNQTIVCKRVDSESDLNASSSGKFGQVGTSGILASGDAFNCDVNGDGNYTERFYYVANLEGNENVAVLIYNNNVSGGEISNTTEFVYYGGSEGNSLGPITAFEQLPTIDQWSNLKKIGTRKIKDEKGIVKVSNFDYGDKVARLLTTQELESACGITVGNYNSNELKPCDYLMENTWYNNYSYKNGYWLENTKSEDSSYGWVVNGYSVQCEANMVSYSSRMGVRPVIEVPKTRIEY